MSDSPPIRPPLPPPLPRRRSRTRRLRDRLRFFGNFRNALLGWEVLRAADGPAHSLLRTALGGLLLAAMWALWSASFTGESTFTGSGTEIGKRLNRFAESFAVTFFMVQATVALLLTPVFVAGAIFEERETRSGEILLTTELTRREVYIGKLGARMVQVLLVVMAGMPILFLTQLWGGVSLGMILVNYAATMIAIVGAGVVTAAISAYAETLRGAILRTYGFLLLVDVLFFPASPYFVIGMAAAHWGAGLGVMIIYLPMQLVLVMVGYSIGQRWLRMAMLRQKTRLNRRPGSPPPLPGDKGRRLPPLQDIVNPLLWKELNASGRITIRDVLKAFTLRTPTLDDRLEEVGFLRWAATSHEVLPSTLRICGILVALFLFGLTITNLMPSNWVVRNVGALVLCWLLSAVGLTAATGLARERQKQTLIDLLMLPGPRRDLLRAKALGALSRGLWPAIALAAILFTGVVGRGASLLSAAMLIVTAAGLAKFSTAIGVWLSARCRTALSATANWIGIMAAIVIGTFLLAEANQAFIREAVTTDYPAWSRVLNPILAWGRLTFWYDYQAGHYSWGADESAWPLANEDLLPALLCPIVYAAIGALLWLAAVRRFEKEGRT